MVEVEDHLLLKTRYRSTCTDLCISNGGTCTGIGTDSLATNGLFKGYTTQCVDRVGDDFPGNFWCLFSSMNNVGGTCLGRDARWTNCKCSGSGGTVMSGDGDATTNFQCVNNYDPLTGIWNRRQIKLLYMEFRLQAPLTVRRLKAIYQTPRCLIHKLCLFRLAVTRREPQLNMMTAWYRFTLLKLSWTGNKINYAYRPVMERRHWVRSHLGMM